MCTFKKQAVGYINYRVIDLSKDISYLGQKRYANIHAFEDAIIKIEKRKGRLEELGYDCKRGFMVEVEEVCASVEYGKYLNETYKNEDLKINYGRYGMKAVIELEKDFQEIINDKLYVDNINTVDMKLPLDRASVKKKYDDMLKSNVYKPVTVEIEKGKLLKEKRLIKIVEFAEKNKLYFKKSDYKNIHEDMDWLCLTCEETFTVKFKRLKDRATPCPNCSKEKGKNGGGLAVRNMKKLANENNLIVDTSSYDRDLGSSSRLVWTCEHDYQEAVTIKTMKNRIRSNNSCPICMYGGVKVVEKEVC